MSKKAKQYFGCDMYIGVYFLNTWLDLMNETDIQQAFNGIQKQPFKALPKLIQAGVNSYNEIEGKDERITFIDACEIFEDYGVNSDDFQNIVKDLTASLKIDNPEKKEQAQSGESEKIEWDRDVYSFALGELGMSSLEDVYKMSWREFQLRLMAHKRMVRDKHLIARQITYYAGYAMHTSKAKPIDQFWNIDVDKGNVSEKTKNRMREVLERERAKIKK